MLNATRVRGWAPRYFSASRAAQQRRHESGTEETSTKHRSTPRCARQRTHRTQTAAGQESRLLSSDSLFTEEDAARRNALAPVIRQVPDALWQLERHSQAQSSREVLATSFVVKRDVLSPLSLALPPPPQVVHKNAQAASSGHPEAPPRRPRLVVVPDDELTSRAAHVGPLRKTPPSPETPKRSVLSLEEVTLTLILYNTVESEDGVLLQQILGEVDRFLTENARPLLEGPRDASRVKLPLPALLLALSQVGVAVEHTLDRLIRRPVYTDEGAVKESGGVLYTQLGLYDIHELLQLLAGLHRFGFHQHYAFEQTVKALRVRWWRPRSPEVARVQAAVRRCASPTPRGRRGPTTGAEDTLVHGEKGEDGLRALRELLTQEALPRPLCIPDTRLFVEVLTALSLSVFRRLDTVSCVTGVLTANVLVSLNEELSSAAKHTMSQQLHRAVQLCESMELEQPLLAEVFGLLCSASGKGILFDGGEDTDGVPTERRAYYDHVTADLIKVNHL